MMSKSPLSFVTHVLLLVGGVNWGLDGLGMLLGRNLNVVNLLVGTWPTVEAVVYLLVGVSAVVCLFSCGKCCDGGKCE